MYNLAKALKTTELSGHFKMVNSMLREFHLNQKYIVRFSSRALRGEL